MEKEDSILCSLTSKEPTFRITCEKFILDYPIALKNDRETIFKKYNNKNNGNYKAKDIKEYSFWNYWNKKLVDKENEVKIYTYDKRIIYSMYLFSFAITLTVGITEYFSMDYISVFTKLLILFGFAGTSVFSLLIILYKKKRDLIITINKNGIIYKNKLHRWSENNFVFISDPYGLFLTIKKPRKKRINIKMNSMQYLPKRVLNLIYQYKKFNSEES